MARWGFDFGHNNHLNFGCPIVSDDDYDDTVGWWTSGRLLGRYVSVMVPNPWSKSRMLRIFGTFVSGRSVREAAVHTVVEIVTLVVWLALARNGDNLLSVLVLSAGLYLEHVLALAAGKDA